MFELFRSEKLHKRGASPSNRRILRFEGLEDRRLLATLTVNLSSDGPIPVNDGNLSLREALAYVNQTTIPLPPDTQRINTFGGTQPLGVNDRIVFESGLSGETIALLLGELSISRSVTIDASMLPDGITIDAASADPTPESSYLDGDNTNDGDGIRIFNIFGTAAVEMIGLTLRGADVNGDGGAIRSDGDLTLRDCLIEDNRATAKGGGIFVSGANLVVISTTIHDNHSATGGGAGVAVEGGNLSLEGSAICDNYSGWDFGGGPGGGIYFQDTEGLSQSELEIRSSTITGNTSQYAGGGLYARADNASVRIYDSKFDSNTKMDYSYGFGGGVYLKSNFGSTITMTNTTISNNKAQGVGSNSGGIHLYVRDSSDVDLDRLTIVGNEADDDAGGLFIYNFASEVRLRNSMISGNSAADNDQLPHPSSSPGEGGGGLVLETFGNGAKTTVENCTVFDNEALGHPPGNPYDTHGGGVLITGSSGTNTTILNSTISGNRADGFGGGIWINPDFQGGFVQLLHCTITLNRANLDNDGTGTGGGIHRGNVSTTVTLDHTIVAGNFRGTGSTRSDISGAVTASWSLIGDNTGATITDSGGNQIGTGAAPIDPGLSELDEWGGPKFLDGSRMLTHRPLLGSRVIDRGNPSAVPGQGGVPQWDQRGLGFSRRVNVPGAPTGGNDTNAIIDIGAVEYETFAVGDYNRDTRVDAGDYTRWRNTLNNTVTPFSDADGDGSGVVGIPDYSIWKANYGAVYGVAGGSGGFYVPGDYDLDGTVGQGDYELWLNTLGSTTNLAADGNGNSIIDLGDLAVWQEYLGVTTLEVLAGDFNGDAIVDTGDYDLWMAGDAAADADGDGVVLGDTDDYDIWMAHFGTVRADVFPFIVNSAPGLPLEIPGAAPRVIGVAIGGFDFASVVGSGQQLRSLPVANPNSISIRFSEEVFVTQGALQVVNLDGASPASVTSFVYDLATQTATWTFNAPLADGRTLVRLADSVFDLDHDALDGEFTNPWSLGESGTAVFPSGDGTAGGEFRFRFTVLSGDSDHDNVHGTTNYQNWHGYEPGMILVGTTTDEFDGDLAFGDVSLREAVHYANTASEPTTIVLPAGRYALTRIGTEGSGTAENDLDVLAAMTILGDGAGLSVIVPGWSSAPYVDNRLIEVRGPAAHLVLQGVTLANAGSETAYLGMAALVQNQAKLEIIDSAVVNNNSHYDTQIAVHSMGSDLVILRSVIANNQGADGSAVLALVWGGYNGSLTIGESIFALNTRTFNNSWPNVRVGSGVAISNLGHNLYDNAAGGFFNVLSGAGDHLGTPTYVVTTVADTFYHGDNAESLSVREAVDLANQSTGAQEIWLPAWKFILTRDRGTHATDTDVSYGDLDIKGSIVIRGVAGRTSVAWQSAVVDKVFDLLGDYNGDGEVTAGVSSGDWAVWDEQYGQSGSWEQFAADGDDDGDVDGDDETIWLQSLGNLLQLFDVFV